MNKHDTTNRWDFDGFPGVWWSRNNFFLPQKFSIEMIHLIPADLASSASSLRLTQRRTNGTIKEMADEMKRKMPANQKGTS